MDADKSRADHPGLERLTGLVERVTFHSVETGFAVLRVKVQGWQDLVTVVGNVPNVAEGEWMEARGRWVIDREHGRQLKAEVLRTSQPNTPEGIEKYLGSGLIKGIGPQFASRLVNTFGTEVFGVIETTPDRLRDVAGIGKVRQARITAAWEAQRKIREIMVFLYGHGVGTSRAFRIYKAYGDQAIEKVRENPYRLAQDIWGIGFKTADRLAESLGIDRQSALRARAGVEYALQVLTEEGHCAYPREELVNRAVELLTIPPAIVEAAIDHGIKEDRLVQRTLRGSMPLVYLAGLDACEDLLARSLLTLAKGLHPCPQVDVARAIVWVEKKLGLQLAQTQHEALAQTVASKVVVITGGPGVGKTTLVQSLVKILEAKKQRVVLCAPTGRAAKRLSEATGSAATTIHRLLEFDPATAGFKRNTANPLEGDAFVVDEASMIDLVLAHQLVRAIPPRAALVLVGDVDQLPSVGPGCVLRDVIDSGVVPVCRLTEVFRQAARSEIVANAHHVNQGRMPEWEQPRDPATSVSDFYFVEAGDPAKCVDTLVQLVRERIPKRFGFHDIDDIQLLTPMQRGELGARNLNGVLQEALNPQQERVERYGWSFGVGDKVMQLVNDYDKEVFNGDIGRVLRLNQAERELTVRFDEREVVYDYDELDELTPAYAVTVHKSQGSEYPCVVMVLHTQHYALLQRNLLYTALTRGRKLVVLVGSKRAVAIAVKRTESHSRVTTLRERLMCNATGYTSLPATEDRTLAAEEHADYQPRRL